jgi:hypothetical protein
MKIKDMKLALALGFGIASLTPSPTRAQEDRFQALAKSPQFENRPTMRPPLS